MKTYSRVYFSLCLFLAISGRSRTQQKLNPREKLPIYGSSFTFPISLLKQIKHNVCIACIPWRELQHCFICRSDVGPVSFEAIGIIDSSLETVAVFDRLAKKADEEVGSNQRNACVACET